MRVWISLLVILGCTTTAAAQGATYLNYEGNPIPLKVYKTLGTPYTISLEVAPDTFQYVTREFKGQISHPVKVFELLTQASGSTLDSNDVVIVLFQNGGDAHYDFMNESRLKSFYKGYQKYLDKLDAEYFFLCPNPGAMGRLAPYADWIQDPGGFFGRNFFKYETWYESYLVMSPDGKYICYLDEHSKDQIKEAVKWVREE